MGLTPGTRIGAYEILGLLGTGGMGEVYRARDARLGRDVAIKVLPPSFAEDPLRVNRFEHEARAAAALNHPNIVVVFDVGVHEAGPYVVSELLEGRTLRSHLAEGRLPLHRALDYASQIAKGLAAAHRKGIVHRDLKPENVLVTRDGRPKILDFGLAKQERPASAAGLGSDAATASLTSPGGPLGTPGYMSPEQVQGLSVDARSDLFSFGAVLYEMLAGRRAFSGDTGPAIQAAILKDEPRPLPEGSVPEALERILKRCLEKDREERFESARDLAFQLDELSKPPRAIREPRRWFQSPGIWVLAGTALVLIAGVLIGQRFADRPPPSFQQLTFRRGRVVQARFSPDGHSIYYCGEWDGAPPEVFSTQPGTTVSQALGLAGAQILSVTDREMAVLLHVKRGVGTLARVPLGGGAPREVLQDVFDAHWSSDGSRLAVVRLVGDRYRLEYPSGKLLYETAGLIAHPRVSPDGDAVAFLDAPVASDSRGSVVVMDLSGRRRTVSSGWSHVTGLAWHPNGREVWFTAARVGFVGSLYAMAPSGRERFVTRTMADLALHDISSQGRVLLAETHPRQVARGLPPGGTVERDLSWLDWPNIGDLSADGRTLLFSEEGEGGGPRYSVYLRSTDGAPAVRLGEGQAFSLSADGRWVAAALPTSPPQLQLLPTGPGEPITLPRGVIAEYQGAWWFPDGKRLLLLAHESAGSARYYVQDVVGGEPRAVSGTPLGQPSRPLAPDGRLLVKCEPRETAAFCLVRVEGGEPHPVPGLALDEYPVGWSADGRFLFVRLGSRAGGPDKILRLDVSTGQREPWRELKVEDPAGVWGIYRILLSADGRSYVYQFNRVLDVLYLADGLR